MKVLIIGTRGIPANYGGFESLAQYLNAHSTSQISFEVLNPPWNSRQRQSSVLRLCGRLVELNQKSFALFYGTWLITRDLSLYSGLLVTNAVYVWVLRLKRHPSVVVFHTDGLEYKRKKWGILGRLIHYISRRAVAKMNFEVISDSQTIAKAFPAPAEKQIKVITYGGCERVNDAHLWKPLKCENPYFLVVARPVPENQLDKIVDAFISASNTKCSLRVIGAPKRPDRYWKKIKSRSADFDIHFLPANYDTDYICDQICNCYAMIHGHSVGGANPSLILALSHLAPVLAYDCIFNREVGRNQATYWRNSTDLATQLSRIAIDPSSRPQPSACTPTWHEISNKYQVLFEELINTAASYEGGL